MESSGEVPLVRVEDDPRAESPQSLRFSAFYAIFRADRLIGRGQPPRTVESYDQTAALFVEAAGDPVLADVREQTLEDFARWVQSRTWRGQTISLATQRKHLTQLGPILDFAGPRSVGVSRKASVVSCMTKAVLPAPGAPPKSVTSPGPTSSRASSPAPTGQSVGGAPHSTSSRQPSNVSAAVV